MHSIVQTKLYHSYTERIAKYIIGLKTLLQQGKSEPVLNGDLVCKFKRNVRKPSFPDQLKKIIKHYKKCIYVKHCTMR